MPGAWSSRTCTSSPIRPERAQPPRDSTARCRKPSANAAAIKAFVVNRVGDFGFLLGIFGTFLVFGTVSIPEILAAAPGMAGSTIGFLGYRWDTMTILCVLLFIGAMGKSAQLGLHTWLPDAMEGPTPVSALIHAATMVTAGVFLVARFSPVFELAPAALAVVTVIGASTAFFAATIGLTQFDIKRVIAYSTCSQLGYMFFAAGVGAFGAAMFHLFTHAFFKALLFMASGSVMHAMGGVIDMRQFGGLRKVLAKYHQVLGVNRAIEAVRQIKERFPGVKTSGPRSTSATMPKNAVRFIGVDCD